MIFSFAIRQNKRSRYSLSKIKVDFKILVHVPTWLMNPEEVYKNVIECCAQGVG